MGVGVLASYVDANNFIAAWTTGINVLLYTVIASVWSGLINVPVIGYAAYKFIEIRISGASAELYYDGVQYGATQTIVDAGLLAATKAGLLSSGVACGMDNFTVI